MAEDMSKKAPEQDDFQFADAACSPEFGSEGCKLPDEDEEK